jgi:predicted nuclease with TOPRIM domain
MAYNSTPKLPKKAPRLQDSLVTKIQEIRELKDTIKDLHTQAEKDKQFLREVQDESNNLELALKKCILSKAELNNKIEQLTDDLEKYIELYASTKIVAQALGEAVYYLTKEKTHG